MRTIVLSWEETAEQKAVVNVPDDFDLSDPDTAGNVVLALYDLTQETYHSLVGRSEIIIESERPYDERVEELFDDE